VATGVTDLSWALFNTEACPTTAEPILALIRANTGPPKLSLTGGGALISIAAEAGATLLVLLTGLTD
jgi:hypothetical protein